MFQNNERNPQIVVIPLGTQAASITLPGFFVRKRSRIKNVYLADQAGIAASGSNWIDVKLQDNSTPVVYAEGNTKAGIAALTQLPIALAAGGGSGDDVDSASQPETDVPAGTMLNVALTKTGTVTTTAAVLIVELYNL
jgi:hypothetical protein